ncbi:Mu transposase C-terminal domain-containing protein [Yersinia intermedia]|uniref:Transposon Tn7 transposition protein tnsB n=1 Tax=Yersinia intermedia TaxID=631 RepID=A0A0T9MUY0_YERIN|nr:Mu transposase C-terminal domain-containing protein [Yersinia intermedia]CNG47463.1 Transposon Tn7 transposition protein tnsB [Yersinia intermedia]
MSQRENRGDISYQDLNEHEQREINRRITYVRKIVYYSITSFTEASLRDVIQEVSKELGDKPPHWQTLIRWYKLYRDAGFKMKGLIPNHSSKGHRQSRIDDKIIEIINNKSKSYYNQRQPSYATIWREIRDIINEYNINNPFQALTVPSVVTVRARLEKASYFWKKSKRSGKLSINNELACESGQVITTRILERVEIDHTPLDIYLTMDDGTLMGRPYLTVIIDHYSHMVMGVLISFVPPSFRVVSTACINAFLPKGKYMDEVAVKFPWPAHGRPDLIVTDNANEFWGKKFTTVADEFGSIFQFCPIRKGRYKSRVERFFGILNSIFLDRCPGVIRKPNEQGEDYNARKEAKMSFQEFRTLLIKWITGDYHNYPLSKNGLTPNELWNTSASEMPVPEENEMDLLLIMLGSVKRKLAKGGIGINNLDYNSPALKSLLSGEGPHLVTVRYNEFDLGHIYVFSEKNKTYIKVPCEDFIYANGLSLYQHSMNSKKVRVLTQYKKENVSLQLAQIEIAAELDQIKDRNHRRKNQTPSSKSARLKSIGIVGYEPLQTNQLDNSTGVNLSINISSETEEELDLDGWSAENE